MFIADQFIFLQLQKTGCMHVARLLKELVEGKQVGLHNRATPAQLDSGRTIIGSVRDPWDWYVSLWSYGCGGKGGFYQRVTPRFRVIGHGLNAGPSHYLRSWRNELARPTDEWRACYADADDPALFRRWLRMAYDPARRYDFGKRYAASSLPPFAGLFTYRYVFLFARRIEPLFDGSLCSTDDLLDFDSRENVVKHVIRNDALEDDLINALIACDVSLSDDDVAYIKGGGRTNASSRRRDLSYYYDAETAALVADREALIVRKHGYTSPLESPGGVSPSGTSASQA